MFSDFVHYLAKLYIFIMYIYFQREKEVAPKLESKATELSAASTDANVISLELTLG